MNIKSVCSKVRGLGLAALLVGFAANGVAQTYTAIDLGTVLPNAIDNSGQVAGNNFTTLDGFLYTGGVLVDIGALGTAGSQAYSINNKGQIVGLSSTTTNSKAGLPHAFLYSGTMLDLGTFSGTGESQANGVNN